MENSEEVHHVPDRYELQHCLALGENSSNVTHRLELCPTTGTFASTTASNTLRNPTLQRIESESYHMVSRSWRGRMRSELYWMKV